MDRFVQRSGEPESAAQPRPQRDEQKSKMAAAPAAAAAHATASPHGRQHDLPPGTPASPLDTGTPATEPLIPGLNMSCKTLALEVAKLIVPDITASLEATIAATFAQVQKDIANHSGLISELENRVGVLEDEVFSARAQIQRVLRQNIALKEKTEDLENRSRRSNLRLIGLPETIQASQLSAIFATELPQALGLQGSFLVERAHRVGPPLPPSDAAKDPKRANRPRPLIAKYLNFADKQLIMQTYRKASADVLLRGHKILLFHDFSADVAKKRRAFAPVCTLLLKHHLRFTMVFPATLKVFTDSGDPKHFCTPEDAEKFVKALQAQETADLEPKTKRRMRSATIPDDSMDL